MATAKRKSSYKKLKKIGEVADAFQRLKEEIDQHNAEIASLKADAEKYELDAIAMSKEAGNRKIGGSYADGVIEEKEHFNVADPAALGKWIVKTKNIGILHMRVSTNEYEELRKAGKAPPGIKSFKHDVLKTKKIKSKD